MASYMELLNKFQYPKSSLLNLLNVMVECGFLIKNKNGYYSLGIKTTNWVVRRYTVKIYLRWLSGQCRSCRWKVDWFVILGRWRAFRLSISTRSKVRTLYRRAKAGLAKIELHITALGKALLARKTREELDYFLEALTLTPHTRNTFTDKKLFLEELQKHAFGDGP